jgi:hypothetical protein
MKRTISELKKMIQEEVKAQLKEAVPFVAGNKKKADFDSSAWNRMVQSFSKELELFTDKKIKEYEEDYDIHPDASKHHLPYEAMKILLAKRY